MTVGKFLKERRKDAEMTQLDLVLKTRITQSQLSDYEHDRAVPSAERFIALCRAMDVDVLDLTSFEAELEDTGEAKGLYPGNRAVAAYAEAA